MTTKAQKEEAVAAAAANPAITVDELKKSTDRHEQLIYLVIIVLFVGFFLASFTLAAFVVDDFRSKEASYTDLVKSIEQTNAKVDSLSQQFENCNAKKTSGC